MNESFAKINEFSSTIGDFKQANSFLESRYSFSEQSELLAYAFQGSNYQFISSSLDTMNAFLTETDFDYKEIIDSGLIQLSIKLLTNSSEEKFYIKSKKQCFNFLLIITEREINIARYLISVNAFEELGPLLQFMKDNFTSVSVSKLFLTIINYGCNFAQEACDHGAITACVRSFSFFTSLRYGAVFSKYAQHILIFLNAVLKHANLVDSSVIESLINVSKDMIQNIIELSYHAIPNVLDSFCDMISQTAELVSNIAKFYPQNGLLIFKSCIIQYLINQLNSHRMSKCWYDILEASLTLLEIIPDETDEKRKLESLINPVIIYEILITDITSNCSIPACHILSIIIEDEPSILESFNLDLLCAELEKNFNSLPFAKRSEITRLCFSIMLQNNSEFTFFLMEKEIVQTFPSLLDGLDDEMKKKSIYALRSGIDSLSFNPKRYHGLVDLLCDEYSELLEDWSHSEDTELAEAAITMSSFLEEQKN